MTKPPLPVTPKLGPMSRWCAESGMGRSKAYEEISAGRLRAVKCGRLLLIDIERGLADLRERPQATIRPRTRPRRRELD